MGAEVARQRASGVSRLRREDAVAIVLDEQGSLAQSGHGQATPSTSGVHAVLESAFTPLVLPRVGEDRVDARDEADRARARGYADGFAEGRRVADAEAQERLTAEAAEAARRDAAAARAVASALAALGHARTQLDAGATALAELAADRIEALALQLAATIIDAELADDARSAAHALRRALAETTDAAARRILLNADDHRLLLESAALADVPDGIELVAVPEVGRGGAIVLLDDGAVDARIAQALARAVGAWQGDGADAEARA